MPTPWTYAIPEGLRRRLDAVLSQRSRGAAEVWAEVRDWLEASGIERPDHVQDEQFGGSGSAQRDQ